jgi:hypothetical protein
MNMHATNTWNGLINLSGVVALAAGFTVLDGSGVWQSAQADNIESLQAAVIATNIPGASAIAQVGIFLGPPNASMDPRFHCYRGSVQTRSPDFFLTSPNPVRYWTPTDSWLAAGRTSARLRPA